MVLLSRRLIFGALQHLAPAGMTVGSWRHPDNQAVDYLSFDHWMRLGRQLEHAGFDFLFLADSFTYPVRNGAPSAQAMRDAIQFPFADPFMVAPAVAAATSRLGIAVTASTMAERPVPLARRLATLDNASGGRVGWNIVTGAGQSVFARLFGEEGMTRHDKRYEIAEDFTEATLELWEGTWSETATVGDKDSGAFVDPSEVREITHEGPYFRTEGLLTVPPSAQRTPVLFQAGTSASGKRFAAKFAEAVFVTGGNRAKTAQDIRDVRRLAETEFGRDPESIVFLSGAMFVTGETDEAAAAKRDEMLALATLAGSAEEYRYYTGIDLTELDPDKPLPPRTSEEGQTSVDRYIQLENPPTVREILDSFRRDGVNGLTFVGSGTTVADGVEQFVAETGVDGFLMEPYLTPGSYDDFIAHIRPELIQRGLWSASDCAPTTLRQQLFADSSGHLPVSHPGAEYRFTGTSKGTLS